jgi:hypothetical protein
VHSQDRRGVDDPLGAPCSEQQPGRADPQQRALHRPERIDSDVELVTLRRPQAVLQTDPGSLDPRPLRDLTVPLALQDSLGLQLEVGEQLVPPHARTVPHRAQISTKGLLNDAIGVENSQTHTTEGKP